MCRGIDYTVAFSYFPAVAKAKSKNESAHSIKFSLGGLMIFVVALIVGTALVSRHFYDANSNSPAFVKKNNPSPDSSGQTGFTRKGPWGELVTEDIKLQRPIEYLADEYKNLEPVTWNFAKRTPDQIKSLLTANGLTGEQVEKLMTASHWATNANQVTLIPDENFLWSLAPTTRSQLYVGLYGQGVNTYIDYPYTYSADTLQTIYANAQLNPDDLALMKQVVYPVSHGFQLTDYNLLMRKIPSDDRRLLMARLISTQSAVMARLNVRPDSDIDKIAEYWGHVENVHLRDIRPMLEGLKALPQGGSISLTYLLPPFPRSHLYTYPSPSKPGDPLLDCNWSAFNFSNLEPDNRINDTQFMNNNLVKNYFEIGQPSQYGDVILYFNQTQFKHAAVFLADDLAYTKYGWNYRQPWMIVRLADMQAGYPTLKPRYFRKRTS